MLRREYRRKWARKNRDKIREQRRRHRKKHPDKERHRRRVNDLRRTYGIEIRQWEALFKSQGGVCAICGNPETYRRLSMEHEHRSGKIRGLLCNSCNNGLGRFFDSEKLLRAAAKYIKKHT